PANDLARLALPHVDAAELEPVGVRVLPRLDHAADAEQAEVAVRVRDAAALDALDLRRGHGKPLRERAEPHPRGDVVAQPGDRNPQNGVRTRRSPSHSGLMSGKS